MDGRRRASAILDGNWTAVISDGSLYAPFEATVHVTETGAEVLTL
jgi:methionine aminopeptidase